WPTGRWLRCPAPRHGMSIAVARSNTLDRGAKRSCSKCLWADAAPLLRAPATMNDEGLADVQVANPFRLPRLYPGIGFVGSIWTISIGLAGIIEDSTHPTCPRGRLRVACRCSLRSRQAREKQGEADGSRTRESEGQSQPPCRRQVAEEWELQGSR